MHAREALRRSFARLIPYTDDITVTARPEITYWQSPRPEALLNTVRHIHAADAALPGLVDEVVHAHRGRPSSWYLERERGRLPQLLAAAGYSLRYRAQGFWIDASTRCERPPGLVVERVTTASQLAAFERIDAAVFGDGGPMAPEEHAAIARACFGDSARLRCFLAYRRDRPLEPLACGRLYVFDELDFGLLQASATLPHARGLGAYSALLAARIDHARDLGLSRLGLYALESTSAPIVARRGFRPCGSLTNWSSPTPAPFPPALPGAPE